MMTYSETTTEELIVQYLDGELVRREMEAELFQRLATSPDARVILREHLILRGAIRMSQMEERFQLSPEVDQRTRARLERVLETLPELELTEPIANDSFRGPIASSPIKRRMPFLARNRVA